MTNFSQRRRSMFWQIANKHFLTAGMLLFILPLLVSWSGAQTSTTTSVTDGTTPNGLKPGAPAGSFALSGFDNINPFSGSLNFSLPLLQIGGRGSAGYTMILPVEQRWRVEFWQARCDDASNGGGGNCGDFVPVYTTYADYNWWAGLRPGYGPGVLIGRRSGAGYNPCPYGPVNYAQTLSRLTFIAPDGTETELRDQLHQGQPQNISSNCLLNPGPSRGNTFVSADGSAMTFISDAPITDDLYAEDSAAVSDVYLSGYLSFRDGTRYRFDGGQVTWIRDRNGNKVTFSYGGYGVSTITDSLNRQVQIEYDVTDIAPYGLCDRITYTGFSGASRVVRISKTSLGNTLRAGFSIQTDYQLFPETYGPYMNPAYASPFNPQVTSAVWLQDGRSYKLLYNSYGELARVELPTGGAFEYDWLGGSTYAPNSGVLGGGGQQPAIYRRVVERRVYRDRFDSNSLETKMTLSRENGSTPTVIDLKQSKPDNAVVGFTRHYYVGNPTTGLLLNNGAGVYYPNWDEGKEFKTEALTTDGATVLRRVENTWQQGCTVSSWSATIANNPRLGDSTTTLVDANQVSKQSFSYDCYNNQTDIYEYDYGAGAVGTLIRRSHTDYLTLNSVNGANYATDTSIHMRSLPSQQQVFDAGGTERSRATFEYDNYTNDSNHAALENRPGITGMDPGYTTAYTRRGNVTRASRFNLANTGLVGSDTEFAAYSQYDIAGNVVKTKDPKGNVSQIGYSSTYQYALPTTQTSPIPDPSGYYASNTAFTTTIAYDFWTGKMTSTTDPNSQVTTAEYIDALDRLTRVARPAGGGETTYEYGLGDSSSNRYIRARTKQDASTWIEDYTLFDGLGRAWRAAHYEGPDSWSAKETKFDALGRVSQVSNPYSIATYNAATPAGALWTTTNYDALSRVLSVTTPDGSHVDTAYSGNQVTVTDQSLKKRRSYTDALGRLTQVTEDPNGLAYQTYYTYDILNNLVKVNQGAQNRYFMYDSLSRLARAKYVEQDANGGLATSPTTIGTYPGLGNSQWTMGYAYDPNGNLTSRTDPRNYTTSYYYDALNRNIYITYGDGVTPYVERHYDGFQGGAFVVPNGKGRFFYHFSPTTNPTTGANANSRLVVNSYDAMGRVTSQRQGFVDSGGATWKDYTVSRTYDLAGHVLSQTYPSGRTVSYTYNAGGRTGSFAGSLGDGVTRTYADTFSYNAAGQIAKERFGTAISLYHNIHYNNRLQMADIRLGTSATDEWTWNRGALLTYFSNQARSEGNALKANATDNNGNVTMQEHYVPTDDAISSYAITLRDTYEYDGVNRLTQTNGLQRTTAGAWNSIYAQWYNYDQCGNRTINTGATWGNAINNAGYTVSASTNRVNGMGYDLAGNVSSDGGNAREYDGENRMKKAWGSSNWNYYVYDADGKRVRRIIGAGATETWQVYGIDGELAAEYPVNGTANMPQKEYGYRDGQMLVIGGCDVVRWIVADHLGTPRIEVDVTGMLDNPATPSVVEGIRRHDYLPFGEELTVGMGNGSIRSTTQGYTADCVRQRFTGYERDNETGLDFAQARYYSNVQGRFTSVDPLMASGHAGSPQSWNRYSYTLNRPLSLVDPTGLEDEDPDPQRRRQPEQQQQQNQQQNQQQRQGQKVLLVVGDPGLREHNVGRNFQRAADTRQAELERQGAEVVSVRASNVSDFNDALTSNGTLDGVEYFGHATYNALFVGETSDPGTNLDASNVSRLSNANLSAGCSITINACYAGSGGSGSIAAGIARQLDRTVTAYDGPTRFSTNPQRPDGRSQPPRTGPIYLVPDPGVRQRTFTPR